MNKNLSIYLDLFRFTASLMVMFAHLTFPQYAGNLISYQGELAGLAVTGFWILSGYVIAFVANEKETDIREFSVSRLARVYSVAIPSIILTMALAYLAYYIWHITPEPSYQYKQLWKYLPVFFTLSNEIGPLHESTFSNGVFWTLSYEIWYYILFGIIFYLRGWKRYVYSLIAIIIMGERIMIYFPLWLLGVALYEIHNKVSLQINRARILFFFSLFTIAAVRYFRIDLFLDSYVGNNLGINLHKLADSMNFPDHYMYGFLVSINIFSARYCNFKFIEKPLIKKVIRYCAGYTFALYLFHVPLRDFIAKLIHLKPGSIPGLLILSTTILFCVWLLGSISEKKKNVWRAFFGRIIKPKTIIISK